MQELHTERNFFDWLRRISTIYGDAMAAWGQEVHDAVARGTVSRELIEATDVAVERLVQSLMSIGAWQERGDVPGQGAEVLDALDRLLGASAELLREARTRLQDGGLPALSALSPRIAELRSLEADVERATEQVRGDLEDRFGDPGEPKE